MAKNKKTKDNRPLWQQAYEYYRSGRTYQEIADTYKVSISTVRSWQQRHWRHMDDGQDDNNTPDNTQATSQPDSANTQDTQQQPLVRINPRRNNTDATCFAGMTAKQQRDIDPADIYNSYSRDNLPTLTLREELFVREFLVDLSPKHAAIRAGYSAHSADSIGCRLMQRADINAHIAVAMAERNRRTGINQDVVIRELARIALANPARVVASDGSIREDASEDDLAAIQAIKVKVTPTKNGDIVEREVRFHDKTRALELYMKAAGMLIERKQVDVTQRVEEMTDDERRQRIRELQSKLAIDVDADVIDD